MKKISNKFGIRKISLNDQDHMQGAYSESLTALGYAIGSLSFPVILYGCTVIQAGDVYNVEKGAIFYQGEIYQVPAHNINIGTEPKWAIFHFVDTSINPSTVSYLSGGDAPVHLDNAFKLQETGITLWSQIRKIEHVLFNKLAAIGDVLIRGVEVDDFFDSTGLGKPYTRYEGWAYMNGNNGTIGSQQRVAVGVDLTNGEYNAIGKYGGANKVKITANQSGVREHFHEGEFGGDISYDSGSSGGRSPQKGGMKDTAGIKNVDNVAGRNGPQDALEDHENRMPFFTIRYLIKVA
jgi:hypothetical protein